MSLEVLDEHFVNAIGGGWVAAGVSHGASAAVQVLPHDHGHLPQSGVGSRGTRWDHAVVEELVVEGVGPAGRPVLVDRHRRVVREVRVPQHFEHVVTADLSGGLYRGIRRLDSPLVIGTLVDSNVFFRFSSRLPPRV